MNRLMLVKPICAPICTWSVHRKEWVIPRHGNLFAVGTQGITTERQFVHWAECPHVAPWIRRWANKALAVPSLV